jgi:hypothetical protein
MKLMTKEVAARIPTLYSQEHNSNPTVQAKFFTPWTNWTWYVIEGEKTSEWVEGKQQKVADWLFFGYVVGHECELGYFTLNELASVRGPAGLKIERDMYFKPTPLSDIKAKHLDEK